ncbi:MAG: PAS domain S-box protein [Pirellulales bacterium]|nr:PAS domain S-box protein [Pirellulales bacterium]
MNVLLIAADSRTKDLLGEALTRRGHAVATVADVQEAETAIRSNEYRMAVFDAGGKDAAAVELCRRVRGALNGRPCALLAADGKMAAESVQRLLEAGADDCLCELDDARRLDVRLAVAEARSRGNGCLGADDLTALPSLIASCPLLAKAPYGAFRTTIEGRFLEVNSALVKMLGYESRDELNAVSVPDDVYRDAAIRWRMVEEMQQAEHMENLELALKRKDGTPVDVLASGRVVRDASGALIGFEGIVHDLTEHKRVADALRRSEEWFRSLIELGYTVYTVLDAQGKVLYESPSLQRVYGWLPEEIVGHSVFDLVHPDELEAARHELAELVAKPGFVHTIETRYRHKDGSWLTIKVSGVNLLDNPSVGGIVLTSHDITELKRAEQTLRESEERYRKLVESSPDGVGVVVDEKIAFTNLAGVMLLGASSPEEVIGRLVAEFVHPDDWPGAREDLRQVLEENWNMPPRERRVVRKDGTCVSTEATATRIAYQGRRAIQLTLRDVTERNRAAGRLKQSEQRYRLIADNVTDVIHTMRVETPIDPARLASASDTEVTILKALGTLHTTYISPSVQRLLGYSPEEAKRLKPHEILTPASLRANAPRFASEASRWLRRPDDPRAAHVLDIECHRKDGTVVSCEATGTILYDDTGCVVGILTVTRDVTQRKKAERALRSSEARLRSLFENLPDFVAILNRQGTIELVNRSTPGTSVQELLGNTGFDFVAAEHQEHGREAFEQAVATGQLQKIEVQDIFGHWWICRLVPIAEEDEVRHVIAISTDITERRKQTEAIHKEQRLLRQLLDLHERDRQLIAYEIHDGFAQQLTGAQFNLEAFGKLRDKDSEQGRILLTTGLHLLSDSIDESRRLISGLRPPILDEFGVVAAVDYLVCEFREREGISIEFDHDVQFDRLAPPVESAIFRIVQESLTNACTHSRSDRIRVTLIQRDQRVTIEVRDWGVGFDPDTVEEHRFGLQGIRERVRLFGGEVTIETSPGQGARINVELPIVETAC